MDFLEGMIRRFFFVVNGFIVVVVVVVIDVIDVIDVGVVIVVKFNVGIDVMGVVMIMVGEFVVVVGDELATEVVVAGAATIGCVFVVVVIVVVVVVVVVDCMVK